MIRLPVEELMMGQLADQSNYAPDAQGAPPSFDSVKPSYPHGYQQLPLYMRDPYYQSMMEDKSVPEGAKAGVAGSQGTDPSQGPAAIRYNNPGAQVPNDASKYYFGATEGTTGAGHPIAGFQDPMLGAANNMRVAEQHIGQPISSMMKSWSGGAREIPGPMGNYKPTDIVTKDLLNDPAKAVPFFKGISSGEIGGAYPMSDEKWQAAHKLNQETPREAVTKAMVQQQAARAEQATRMHSGEVPLREQQERGAIGDRTGVNKVVNTPTGGATGAGVAESVKEHNQIIDQEMGTPEVGGKEPSFGSPGNDFGDMDGPGPGSGGEMVDGASTEMAGPDQDMMGGMGGFFG